MSGPSILRARDVTCAAIAVLLLGAGCATRKGAQRPEAAATGARTSDPGAPGGTTGDGYGKASARDLPIEVVRWGELAHELATSLKREGTSCAGVARAVGAHVDRYGRELGAAQKVLLAWEDRAPKWRVREYYRAVFPHIDVRVDAGIRCKGDLGARKAFDRYFEVMGLDGRG